MLANTMFCLALGFFWLSVVGLVVMSFLTQSSVAKASGLDTC